MKIAIVSYPRTRSSLLQHAVSSMTRTYNYQEFLASGGELTLTEKIDKLNNDQNYVVKFMSCHFVDGSEKLVDWAQYNVIIYCFRESIVDAFLSSENSK